MPGNRSSQATAKGGHVAAVRYAARTPEQLRSREIEKTSVGAWSTVLVALFETDPDVIASVLPKPLAPSSRPLAKATFATVDIPGLPTFGAGSFSVQCTHEGTLGYYCLVMPMSTEPWVIGGRETFGEPKKIGQVTVDVDGDAVHGTMNRMGTTFAEFSGQVTETLLVPAPEIRNRLLLQGPARSRRQGSRRRPRPRLLHPGRDGPLGQAVRR